MKNMNISKGIGKCYQIDSASNFDALVEMEFTFDHHLVLAVNMKLLKFAKISGLVLYPWMLYCISNGITLLRNPKSEKRYEPWMHRMKLLEILYVILSMAVKLKRPEHTKQMCVYARFVRRYTYLRNQAIGKLKQDEYLF